MTPDRAGAVIGALGALILVGSALAVRRRSVSRQSLARMALIWAVILVVLFILARWIDAGS